MSSGWALLRDTGLPRLVNHHAAGEMTLLNHGTAVVTAAMPHWTRIFAGTIHGLHSAWSPSPHGRELQDAGLSWNGWIDFDCGEVIRFV